MDWFHPNIIINPQMPKVKIHLRTPKGGGGWCNPSGFLPSRPNFLKIFLMGMFSGSRNPAVIMKKILSSLHDLENQSQTPFCMTFLISGCKHDTMLILVSIHTFSRSRISNMLTEIMWFWRFTLELKVTHIICMTFLISGCIQATDLILCRF